MQYHAPTGKFVVAQDGLQACASGLRFAIKQIRLTAGLPLEPYARDSALTPADHAQKAIIDAAAAVGIDLGARWGSELDVRDTS
jgi:hypothetical protein